MVFDRERYAYEFNTLPKYIFADAEGKVNNFEYIMTQIDPTDILKVYAEINSTASEKMDLMLTDIAVPFVVFNEKLHRVIHDLRGDMFFVANALGFSEEVAQAVSSIWSDISDQREYDLMMSSSASDRAKFREEHEKKSAEKKLFETAVPFEASEATLSSINNVYTFEKSTSLLGVFNSVGLSESLYLATTSTYYKVLKNTSYALEYPDTDDKIYLFLKGKRLVVEGGKSPLSDTYELTVPEVPKGFDVSDIKRILGAPSLTLTGERLNASVKFYSPNLLTFELNKYIWADLVMNNNFISDKFVIDEHLKPSKSSESVYMFWLKDGDKTAFTLNARAGLDYDKSKYLTIITAKLINFKGDDLAQFKAELASALGVYLALANSIAEEYNKYLGIPIKLKKPKDEGGKTLRLKDIEPEMFVSGYTRACQFMPTIVDEATARELEEKGYKIMDFPLNNSDGEVRYYSCALNPTHIYPGLRVNLLSNKDKYPYLPCCFRQNQFEKNSTYSKYVEELNKAEQKEEQVKVGKGFIITGKILKVGQTGDPPEKLKKLFSLYTTVPVVRIGTVRDPSSILECILSAKRGEKFRTLSTRDKKSLIIKERQLLSKLPDAYFNLISQETWNIGKDVAKRILADRFQYLDPRIFFSLLEYYYDCRLALFSKQDFIRPNYASNFVSYGSITTDIVIAYENYGGEAEHATFPQFEIFTPLDSISEKLYALYQSSFETKAVDNRGVPHQVVFFPVSFEPFVPSKIHSQILGAGGKAVALNLIDEEARKLATFVLKTPLAPLPLQTTSETYTPQKSARVRKIHLEYAGRHYLIEDATPFHFERASESWMNEYISLEKTSKFLVEKARKSASQGEAIAIDRKVDYSKLNWKSKLSVQNVEVKQKLEYTVDLFAKYKPSELEKYKDYKYAPNHFSALFDFENRSNEVISFVDNKVKWKDASDSIETAPLVDKRSFFIEIASKVYHCIKAETLAIPSRCVCAVWNTRSVLRVGNPADDSISFLVNKIGDRAILYRCFLVVKN